MADIVDIDVPWTRLVSNVAATGDNGFTPATDYFEAGAVLALRFAGEMRSRTGTIEIIPAIEFVNTVRGQATVVNLGSTWFSAEGYIDPAAFTGVGATAAGKQRCRLGWVTRNTSGSGTGLSTCEVQGAFEVKFADYDEVLLGWYTVLSASTTGCFLPASGWFDAADAAKLRTPFEVRGLNGLLSVEPAYQTANDKASPDTPVALGGALTADGLSFPSDWATPAVGGKQYIRAGWWVKLTSGSTVGWAAVAGRAQMLNE